MTHKRLYSPVPYVPAPRLRDADGSMRQAPRRSAGYAATHPVQPLKGLPGTRATDVSYRALAPGEAGTGHRVCTGTSESRLTAHYSLLTANSTYTFSAKEKDPETGLSYFGSRYYSSDLSVWLSVDPMASKYPSLSPYTYCADNPVKLVDPNGESISEFDENGNYIRTIKDNWFHNTFFGHSGRIVDSDGDVLKKFYFSDPKHDFEDIKNNVINKIQFVQESEINKMLSKAGAFDEDNKVFSSQGRYSYIQKEGKGGGKFDFSYTGIPFQYPEASRYPLDNPSHIMFLVDNVAYNHMNFGNFLYGAAGKALGLTLNELKIGAHYNSLFNSQSNNYKPQFDSRDDQKCIEMGVRYAKRHGYQNKFFHVVVGYVNNRF